MSGVTHRCDSEETWNYFIENCKQLRDSGETRVFSIRRKTRTDLQNRSEHKYFDLVAERLNDAGYDQKAVFAVKDVGVPWSKDTVKENLWRPVQVAMFDIESTADLSTKETQEVYKVLDKLLSEKFGVHVPWPARSEGQNR